MRSSLNPVAYLLLTALFGGAHLQAQLAVPPTFPTQASLTSQWSTNYADGLTFDALTPFTLNSVSIIVRPTSGPMGNLTINLRDSRGNLLATRSQIVGFYGQFINLGFFVPAGLGHRLEASGTTVAGLQESTNVQNFSGFTQPGMVRILGPIQAPGNRYPFFYDWRISAATVPVLWQTSNFAAQLTIAGPGTPTAILSDPGAASGALTTGIARFGLGAAAPAYRTEATLDSDVPNPLFDVLVSLLPVRPLGAGGSLTAAGPIINIQLDPQALFFLNSGTAMPSLQPLVGRIKGQVDSPSPGSFSAQMIVLDPSSAAGFALSQAVQHNIVRAPTLEDFGNAGFIAPGTRAASRPGFSIPRGFENGDLQWELIDAARASSRPTSATLPYSGTIFAHVPVTALQPRRAVLDTAVHEVGTLTQNRLSFALNRMGQGVGILSIYQISDPESTPTLLRTYSGPDWNQSRGGVEWSFETIPFVPNGPFVQFRFDYHYTAAVPGPGEIAIDAVRVQ